MAGDSTRHCAKKQSFGLIGVHERGLALSGEVEISSMPDQGTIIRVGIPIHNELRNS
ncbi:hypothetical protein SAMN04515620_12642 [Collimonas sp. OK607]|nr:hypothetical protein SAMN04515620_12642 [Collimonas sp. OK607]